MCSARRPHIVYTIGLYTTECCILVHLVVEDFGPTDFPWHCWEDLLVDHLPVIDCFLGSRVSYSWLSLVGYWGLDGWYSFAVQTPVPMEQLEQGRGLEQLASVVHSRLGWVSVPQMWEFVPHIVVSAKPRPGPAAVE